MALNFPSSPVNGQVYGNWIYSTTKGAWEAKPLESAASAVGPTAPLNPTQGDLWFNTNDGTTYVWYYDGDTGQWVESVAPITANGYYSPNYIINGAFEINQRNLTSTTSTGYGFDRWVTYQQGGGTTTHSAQTFTPGAAPVSGYEGKNFVRLVTSGYSAASTASFIQQHIEDVRTVAGKTVTLSFWAKAASGTPKVSVELQQNFGTGGSGVDMKNAGAVTLSTSWSRYSLTVNIPAIFGKTIGINSMLSMVLWVSAGTDFAARTNSIGAQNNTFDFWGVQLEVGSTATPFRRNANSLQGELAACQRYYWNPFYNVTAANIPFAMARAQTSSTVIIHLNFPVAMRTSPTITETTASAFWIGYNGVNNWQFSAFGNLFGTTSYLYIEATVSGTTAGIVGSAYRPDTSTPFHVNAEL